MGAALNERIWFYYADEVQVGPMTEIELRNAIAEGTVQSGDFVYREGFPDWKSLAEVADLQPPSGSHISAVPGNVSAPKLGARGAPRAQMQELVVAHNDTHVATGRICNISISGVYFETEDAVFQIKDEVKLTLKEGKGLGKPMHLKAMVVRQARENGIHVGYGLELRSLDEASRSRIADYVKRHQPT